MGYPDSVLTKSRKGEVEARRLLSEGKFVKYDYIYPETGKAAENGKFSIVLKPYEGKEEHYFLIPMKGRYLAILEEGKKVRKVWDDAKKEAADV